MSLRVSFSKLGNIRGDDHGSRLKMFSQRSWHDIEGTIHSLAGDGSEVEEGT